MENNVKTYQTVQSNLKPLTKMVGMYGYAEKIKTKLQKKKIDTSLYVIYRAIEGVSKSQHSTIIREEFLKMVTDIKDAVNSVEAQADALLN